MITSKHFVEKEFAKCQPVCSLQNMDQATIDRLDKAREIAGISFVLTCAFRTKEWDIKKGRSGNSAHTRGMAVDISCNTSVNRYTIVKALIEAGFKRIGIGDTFVHADTDDSLPNPVMFDYYK